MLQIYLKSHDKLKFEKDSNQNLLEYEKGNLQECEIRKWYKGEKNYKNINDQLKWAIQED